MLKYFEDIQILIKDLVGMNHYNEIMEMYYEFHNYKYKTKENNYKELLQKKYDLIIDKLFSDY